jgi:hypothetical protein
MIGFRPAYVGGDTASYIARYYRMMVGSYNFETVGDWLCMSFQNACAQMMPVSMFFLLVAFLYVFVVYVACKRLIWNNATLIMLCSIGAFSFFSYGVNGIRNGLSTSFVILALAYIGGNTKEKIACALFCFIAFNCHKSAALPIAAMLFAYLYKRPKFMFYVWGLSLVGSLLIGERLMNIFTLIGFDARLSGYLSLEESAETLDAIAAARFRWDFLIYSFMPILLGWYCIFKKKTCDFNYHLLLGTYVYANAVWVILIRLPFTNRFAYLSWFLYGLVLTYPLLKFHLWRHQGRKVALIMMLHVSFTFFMYFHTGL